MVDQCLNEIWSVGTSIKPETIKVEMEMYEVISICVWRGSGVWSVLIGATAVEGLMWKPDTLGLLSYEISLTANLQHVLEKTQMLWIKSSNLLFIKLKIGKIYWIKVNEGALKIQSAPEWCLRVANIFTIMWEVFLLHFVCFCPEGHSCEYIKYNVLCYSQTFWETLVYRNCWPIYLVKKKTKEKPNIFCCGFPSAIIANHNEW